MKLQQRPAFFRVLLTALCAILSVTTSFSPVQAADLTGVSLTLSNTTAEATNVTYTVAFTTASTDNLQQVSFRFSTVSNGSSKPAHLNVNNTTLQSVSGLGSNWFLDLIDASAGVVKIRRNSPAPVSGGSSANIVLTAITNSAIDDCEPANNALQDTCHIRITTYSDTGTSVVDTGTTTYQVSELPTLSFAIDPVASGQTHNGITTTATSTTTTLPFGTVSAGQPAYLAHSLTVTTNAPGGYTVQAYLVSGLTGSYAGGKIDPFAAPEASWTTPRSWMSPDGTTSNTNTGWLGANTTDTRIGGWGSNTSAKFAPFGAIPRPVAYSSGPDRTGTTVYVSYTLEVNGLQPADTYRGTLIYDVRASY